MLVSSSVTHVVVVVALPAGRRPIALLAEIGSPAAGSDPALGFLAALAGQGLGALALLVEPALRAQALARSDESERRVRPGGKAVDLGQERDAPTTGRQRDYDDDLGY